MHLGTVLDVRVLVVVGLAETVLVDGVLIVVGLFDTVLVVVGCSRRGIRYGGVMHLEDGHLDVRHAPFA